MILSPHEIAWLALHVGMWAGDDTEIAVAVALAESGGDTDIMSRSTSGLNIGQRDHGLFQISGRWHGMKLQRLRWRDPYDNTRLARQAFDETARTGRIGWEAWHVYNTGAHAQFLPDARIALMAPVVPINPHTTAWRVQ